MDSTNPQNSQPANTTMPVNTGNNTDFFDPTKDIDLSAIESEIIDTSRGDKVDYTQVALNKIYRFKCLNCGFMYEGKNFLETCPRCGSNKLDDSETVQTT